MVISWRESFFTRNESLARSRANYRPLYVIWQSCMTGNVFDKHLYFILAPFKVAHLTSLIIDLYFIF